MIEFFTFSSEDDLYLKYVDVCIFLEWFVVFLCLFCVLLLIFCFCLKHSGFISMPQTAVALVNSKCSIIE